MLAYQPNSANAFFSKIESYTIELCFRRSGIESLAGGNIALERIVCKVQKETPQEQADKKVKDSVLSAPKIDLKEVQFYKKGNKVKVSEEEKSKLEYFLQGNSTLGDPLSRDFIPLFKEQVSGNNKEKSPWKNMEDFLKNIKNTSKASQSVTDKSIPVPPPVEQAIRIDKGITASYKTSSPKYKSNERIENNTLALKFKVQNLLSKSGEIKHQVICNIQKISFEKEGKPKPPKTHLNFQYLIDGKEQTIPKEKQTELHNFVLGVKPTSGGLGLFKPKPKTTSRRPQLGITLDSPDFINFLQKETLKEGFQWKEFQKGIKDIAEILNILPKQSQKEKIADLNENKLNRFNDGTFLNSSSPKKRTQN